MTKKMTNPPAMGRQISNGNIYNSKPNKLPASLGRSIDTVSVAITDTICNFVFKVCNLPACNPTDSPCLRQAGARQAGLEFSHFEIWLLFVFWISVILCFQLCCAST